MLSNELIEYLEDEDINIDNSWYYHATDRDINAIRDILTNGIKSATLRKEESNKGYNGKFYISVSKKSSNINSAYMQQQHHPIFILDNIKPLKAKVNRRMYSSFMETFIPLRTSSISEEYQSFLKINPNKIIAIGFNLLSNQERMDASSLKLLKEIVLLLDELEKNIPIYDISSNKMLNKCKIKQLTD